VRLQPHNEGRALYGGGWLRDGYDLVMNLMDYHEHFAPAGSTTAREVWTSGAHLLLAWN
jgi:hypothetical protein